MLNANFVIVGAAIALAGTSRYVIDTLRGSTQPNRVTWFMWTLAPMIAFAAELSKGVGIQVLVTFMAGFCPLLVLIASFVGRHAPWRLTKFDFICGTLSILGLILWRTTGEGNVAIAFGILADGLAALPTLIKSYRYPETETWWGFLTSGISAFLGLLTLDNWTFANASFAIYLVMMNTLLISFIRIRPLRQKSRVRSA